MRAGKDSPPSEGVRICHVRRGEGGAACRCVRVCGCGSGLGARPTSVTSLCMLDNIQNVFANRNLKLQTILSKKAEKVSLSLSNKPQYMQFTSGGLGSY